MQKNSRKNSQSNTPRSSQAIVVFWLVFAIVIITAFMANAQTIQKNFNLFKNRLSGNPAEQETSRILPLPEEEKPAEVTLQQQPVRQNPAQEPVDTSRQPGTQTGTTPQNTEPQRPQQPGGQQQTGTQQQPVQTRDRNIYFTHIDKDGQILHSRTIRKIPVSESPMTDALNVMLIGPSADELNRGLINLIPQNTRILSAIIRGSTAYISFSEDFLFNTFGVEGYVAQLRQVVWTVTEFSNIKDVQILIEGRRLDYLGEGIWIGSPISRQSF